MLNTDADLVIVAESRQTVNGVLPTKSYRSPSLENKAMRDEFGKLLEGGGLSAEPEKTAPSLCQSLTPTTTVAVPETHRFEPASTARRAGSEACPLRTLFGEDKEFNPWADAS